ncbi:MAG: polymer-forming cytoskeletal protein [Flavobacteriaceae bacterium]|jgi:cytoskeletal protein CcmA (bactofilin family)|nr:polymer-forming cytoskeletal protein [Flavobacteriaceae bacterium]
MFEKSKKDKGNYVDSLGKTNRIVEGTEITGDIEAIADLRIDGVLKGNLKVNGRVVIGPGSKVFGDIQCENCDIEGVVEGKVNVIDLVHIKATGRLKGELTVGRLAVEPGALLEASCQMLGEKQ